MAKTAKSIAPARAAPKRKRRSEEDLRARIIEAAGVEFKRAGYASATTAAIARRAKVTETQLFRYFGSKANLFREAIFKPLDEQIVSYFESFVRNRETPDRRRDSVLYIGELQKFLAENADMFTSLLVAQRYDPDMADDVGEIESLNAYFERGAATMRAGMRTEPDVDPKLMVRVSFAAVLACVMFKDWLFPKGLASEKEINAAINAFVLEGIAAVHPDLK